MIRSLKDNFLNHVILSILGCFCLFYVVNLQSSRIKQFSQPSLDSEAYWKQQELENLNLSFLKEIPSFGFDNLVANWTMLKFLQYFGDGEARKHTGYILSSDYLEVIVKTDPNFATAYLVISPASSMFGGHPDRTVSLLEKGLETLSPDIDRAYLVWLYKGIDEILFIGDLAKAQKSYEKAAEWAEIAGDQKIAQSASDTAKFLSTNPDIKQAQVGAWLVVWTSAKDQLTRDFAQRKIEELGGTLEVLPDGRVVAKPPKPSKS